jgi:hypothetical protein
MSWLRRDATEWPTWKFTLFYVISGSLSVAILAAIWEAAFHLPWGRRLFGIPTWLWWLLYGVFYTVVTTGIQLLIRHGRMRRRMKGEQTAPW